jgi:hypothetical protein
LEDGYLAILEVRAAEAQQLARRCLTEEQYCLQRGTAGLRMDPLEQEQAAGEA